MPASKRVSTRSGTRYDYLRDGAAIYRQSFAMIRAEADLRRFAPAEARVAVRVIHASGMVDVAADLAFQSGFVGAARAALLDGRAVLCDASMVADGITRSRLPADNPVICTLRDPRVPDLARDLGTTRSAAAMHLWGEALGGEALDGAVVVIGNAPTALFHLLEMLDEGCARPAAIVGMPVGFVGAAESKAALMEHGLIPAMTCFGRRGGSAMAAAALNALASEAE